MAQDISSKFFHRLVLQQFLAHISVPHVTPDLTTSSLWIQAQDIDMLPFWRLLDVREAPKQASLLSKLPDLLKRFKHQDVFFRDDLDRWVAVLEPLYYEKWFIESKITHATIRKVLEFSLNPLTSSALQQIKQIISSSTFPKKEEGLTYIKQAERHMDCQEMDLLYKWVLNRIQSIDPSNDALKTSGIELATVFIPMYMSCVYFKLFCFLVLNQNGRQIDALSAERIQLLVDQTFSEVTTEGGTTKVLMDAYLALSHSESLPLEGYINHQHSLSSSIGSALLAHIHAIRLFETEFPTSVFKTISALYSARLSLLPYGDAIGYYVSELSKRIHNAIDDHHLMLQTITHHDIEAFRDVCLKTESFLTLFCQTFLSLVLSERYAESAKLLLKILSHDSETALWFQWALLVTPASHRDALCHHIIVQCPIELLPTFRTLIGHACIPISNEVATELETFFPSDSRDLFTWGNTVHFVNAWATQVRVDLLKQPSSFWEMVFRTLRVNEISHSPFVQFLLDSYGTHPAETQILDSIIRFFDDQYQKKTEHSNHYFLTLLSFAVFFRKKNLHSEFLIPYFTRIDTLKNSVNTLLNLLNIPPLDSTASGRWLSFVLDKVNQELTGLLLTQPPELVAYILSDPETFDPLVQRTIEGVLHPMNQGIDLFSKLAIIASFDSAFFRISVETISRYLKGNQKQEFLDFLSHRQLSGNAYEKNLAKAIAHFAMHATHSKQSFKRSKLDISSNPIFMLSDYFNHTFSGSFRYFFSSLTSTSTHETQHDIRSFLSSVTPTLLHCLSASHSDLVQRLFKALPTEQTLGSEFSFFWSKITTDEALKRPSSDDILCQLYGCLAQLLLPSETRSIRLPLTVFIPALYNDFRLIPAQHNLSYIGFLQPYLHSKDNPILSLRFLGSIIPDATEAKHRDSEPLVESLLQLIPIIESLLTPSHSSHSAWIQSEQTVLSRYLSFMYGFLLHHSGSTPSPTMNRIAIPLFSFTKQLILKGKLLSIPDYIKTVSPQALFIDAQGALEAHEDCLSFFKSIETLLDLIDAPPSFKGKSFSKLTSSLQYCFEVMPDVFYALRVQKPAAYSQLLVLLYQLDAYLKTKNPQSELLAFIQLHFPHLLPDSCKSESSGLCDLLQDYHLSKGQDSLITAISNRFFGESNSNIQYGFVYLFSFDFQNFKNLIHHRANTIHGLKMSIYAQKLKYTVLLQLFTQLLSHPNYYQHGIQSDLIINLHALIQDLGNQHNNDFESIFRTTESLQRFVLKGEPFLSELLYIRQLLLSHQQDFLASGLFAQDTFSTFADAYLPAQLLTQLFFILITLYTSRLDLFKDTVPHIEEITTSIAQSLLHYCIFSRDSDPALPSVFTQYKSRLIASFELLEKHGRSIIKPVFFEKSLTHHDIETLYTFISNDSTDVMLKRLGYWLDQAKLWESLSAQDCAMVLTLFSTIYNIPFSTLVLGFSSPETQQACLTLLADTDLYLALQLQTESQKIVIPFVQQWLASPDHFHAELSYVHLLAPENSTLIPKTFQPITMDLDNPLVPENILISSLVLAQWATLYERQQDTKSFQKLLASFQFLFNSQHALASRILPTFSSRFSSIFWELIFYNGSSLLSSFIHYLLSSELFQPPLAHATLYTWMHHPMVKDEILSMLFTNDNISQAYPFQTLPFLIQRVAIEQNSTLLAQIADAHRLGQLLSYFFENGNFVVLSSAFKQHTPALLQTLFTAIFSDATTSPLTAELGFEVLSHLNDDELLQVIHYFIERHASDMSFVCSSLFQHHYFTVSYLHRSVLLSRLMHACCAVNSDRFSAVIREISFRPDAYSAHVLSYSYLLTSTTFLSFSDVISTIASLGFIPDSLSEPYLAFLKDALINPDFADSLTNLSKQSSSGFQSLLLIPAIAGTIRTGVKLNTLRPLHPLTRAISRTISTLLPIEILHFLTNYLCQDLSKKIASAILDRLTVFYKTIQTPLGFKKVSENELESLKADILELMNSPYMNLDPEDPIFNAGLSALRYSAYTSQNVQYVLDSLTAKSSKKQDSASQQLYVDSHMANVILHPDSRWAFLCFLEREIKDYKSPLFSRLIEGWDTQYSLWDRYIHASLSPKETIFSQQFLLKLCQQFSSASPKEFSSSLPSIFNLFGFLYTHCLSQREQLVSCFKDSVSTYTTDSDLSLLTKVLEADFLNFEDVIQIITPLLTLKKGVLATQILQRITTTRFAPAMWKQFYLTTKRPVLMTEICTPQSDFDIHIKPLFIEQFSTASNLFLDMCNTPYPELSDFFESWLTEGFRAYTTLHPYFPEFGSILLDRHNLYDDPLLERLRDAVITQKTGILRSIALLLNTYCDDHTLSPSWAYHLVLDCGRITPSDLNPLCGNFSSEQLFSFLITTGYLDEFGLISSAGKQQSLALDHLYAAWPNPVERDSFLLQFHRLIEQRLQARTAFLEILAECCPKFFIQKTKKKSGRQKKNDDTSDSVISHFPKDHPLCFIHFLISEYKTSGFHCLLDDCITALFLKDAAPDLSTTLKQLPLDTVLSLLLYEHRRFINRQHLIDALFSPTHRLTDRSYYAAAFIKKIISHLESPQPEKLLALRDCVLNCFISDAGLFHALLHTHSDLLYGRLTIHVTCLYEARTRLLFLIKSQQDAVQTLLSDSNHAALTLLDLLCASLSLRNEAPDLFAKFCATLQSEYPSSESFLTYLLSFMRPGLQSGRIPSTAFDELPNGADVRLFLQKHFIIDAFGLILIQDFHQLPSVLKSREACISLVRLSNNMVHSVMSHDALLLKEAEKQWRGIVKLLQNHSSHHHFDFEFVYTTCQLLSDFGYINMPSQREFLVLRDLQTDLLSMTIPHLTRPDYMPYISAIFSQDIQRLTRFVAQLPVTITKDDLVKKKIIPEKIAMLLTKLEAEGYLNTQGQLTPHFYSSSFQLSGIDVKETRFWQDFLVSHAHAKRRVVVECLQASQDLYTILHGNQEQALEAFTTLFNIVPRHKWLLFTSILNHPKSIFSLQTEFINRLKSLPLSGWDFQFNPDSLQLAAKTMKQDEISTEDALHTLFKGFKTYSDVSGVNRRQLSKLIFDIAQVIEPKKEAPAPVLTQT